MPPLFHSEQGRKGEKIALLSSSYTAPYKALINFPYTQYVFILETKEKTSDSIWNNEVAYFFTLLMVFFHKSNNLLAILKAGISD